MTCSLIITTYNWPNALKLTLQSILYQTVMPNEIIIADDGSTKETKDILDNFKLSYPKLNIIHSWQEDKGFRAAKSRNKAIAISKSEYIILIDGDIILNEYFIEDHIKSAESGYFIQGQRVLLDRYLTQNMLKIEHLDKKFLPRILPNKNIIRSTILSKLFSRKTKSLKGIKSCNISFFRKDCIAVNGFNEDFIGWGREDSEFVVRLYNYGVKRINLRFKAIIYHLYHRENSRKMLEKNDEILKNSIKLSLNKCDNGIQKYIGKQNEY